MNYLPHRKFQLLISALKDAGYDCFGPQLRADAIVFDRIEKAEELPWSIKDSQEQGKYRLSKSDKINAFEWVNGPQAIKPLLFKPTETLWKAKRDANGKVKFERADDEEQPIAVIGVRPCDLAAMAIQDKVFIEGELVDPRYKARRENLFVVAANCTHSTSNCFCVAAGGSTKAKSHYDLVMTEIDDGFILESGSKKGEEILSKLSLDEASSDQNKKAEQLVDDAAIAQTKKLPKGDFEQLLTKHWDHKQWNKVAERCFSCGNCTMVCPTCFCHGEKDMPTLNGACSEHCRYWDSCFTDGHSEVHGHQTRPDIKTRYRQWLTHKFGGWIEQFGLSGCVGCGRCITWCPKGIDVTEELHSIYSE